MAELLLSAILHQLSSITSLQCQQHTSLILNTHNHIQDLTDSLQMIQALLQDAENKQITNESTKLWLQDLKHIMYDADDLFDEMLTRIAISQSHNSGSSKVRSYVCSLWSCTVQPVMLRHQIARRIVDIKERLNKNQSVVQQLNLVVNITTDDNYHQPRNFTSSIYDASVIRGRDDDREVVVGRLLEESSVGVVGIVGMGGLGKTTLAQLVYNDEKVVTEFELRVWVCVSENFFLLLAALKYIEPPLRERLAMEIVQQATGNKPDVVGWEVLHKLLCKAVEGKRFLLVLDDVWTEDESYWEPLKNSLNGGGQESRIVVTTRNKNVAKMMGAIYTHELKVLSDEECWLFFRQIAFQGRTEEEVETLKEIGRELAKKCKGVPLAAKTLASRMRFENSKVEWRNVLTSDIWGEEQDGRGFFPALLLSYQALRPHLKQCFMYTAIFQEDTRIEKDLLVKLWMAQGFLGLDGTKELEIIGGRCFSDLSVRSFFHEFEQHENGNITCKMHDLVREFAQFLAKTECFSLEKNGVDFISNKVRHIRANAMDLWFKNHSIYEGKKLHTFIFGRHSPISKANLFKLFHQMKCLRALDLSSSRIKELPDEVGKLLHLRYLDLSNNIELRKLPETMSNLYNLQILKLNFCIMLCKLQNRIRELLNLRHLELQHTWCLSCTPKNIGKLGQLRTLSKVIVSEECKIKELGSLNHLGGSLEIEGLDQVEDENEAKMADLQRRENLCSLKLKFGHGDLVRIESVLAGLQPHSNVGKLHIDSYGGSTFPLWMSMCDSLLPNIVRLELSNCRSCTHLPPALGKLRFLDTLSILDLYSVKEVGSQLLGFSSADRNEASMLSLPSVTVLFPKLRKFSLFGMEEWDEEIEVAASASIMPCLQFLTIYNCTKLKVVPHYMFSPSLKELTLGDCPQLIGGMQPCLPWQLEKLVIKKDVGEIISSMTRNNTYLILKSVRIIGSPHSSLPQGLNNFKSLQILEIMWCEFLDLKPEEELRNFPMLRELIIGSCPVLEERCAREEWSTLSSIPYEIVIAKKV